MKLHYPHPFLYRPVIAATASDSFGCTGIGRLQCSCYRSIFSFGLKDVNNRSCAGTGTSFGSSVVLTPGSCGGGGCGIATISMESSVTIIVFKIGSTRVPNLTTRLGLLAHIFLDSWYVQHATDITLHLTPIPFLSTYPKRVARVVSSSFLLVVLVVGDGGVMGGSAGCRVVVKDGGVLGVLVLADDVGGVRGGVFLFLVVAKQKDRIDNCCLEDASSFQLQTVVVCCCCSSRPWSFVVVVVVVVVRRVGHDGCNAMCSVVVTE
jgi:hypothetical protein